MKSQKGFTLIEILIVVAIIAILASIVIIGLGPTQQSGRDARRLADIRHMQAVLQLYYNKCGYYPGTAQATSTCGSYSNIVSGTAASTWTALSSTLTGSNIGASTIPNDPTAGASYYYAVNSTTTGATNYVVAATLENTSNPVFSGYTAPSLTGYTTPSGFSSCAAPNYCITL